MTILIVESDAALASLWEGHLQRQGLTVAVAADADAACAHLCGNPTDVVVLDLDLACGSALAVADFAQYRRPNARVIFVTATSFFSDGSIFGLTPNAAGYLPSTSKPEDLAALVEHHSRSVQPA